MRIQTSSQREKRCSSEGVQEEPSVPGTVDATKEGETENQSSENDIKCEKSEASLSDCRGSDEKSVKSEEEANGLQVSVAASSTLHSKMTNSDDDSNHLQVVDTDRPHSAVRIRSLTSKTFHRKEPVQFKAHQKKSRVCSSFRVSIGTSSLSRYLRCLQRHL